MRDESIFCTQTDAFKCFIENYESVMGWIKKTVFYIIGFSLLPIFLILIYVGSESLSRYLLCNDSYENCSFDKVHWTSGAFWKSNARNKLSQRDPIPIDMFVGWSYEPSSVFWDIEVDDRGYIKTVAENDSSEDELKKIVLVGGSTTAGAGASSYAYTIASELQTMLAKQGYKYNVINAGTGGWTSSNQLAYLTQRLPYEENVEVVIFFDGYNDLMRGLLYRTNWDSHLVNGNRKSRSRSLENGEISYALQHLSASILNHPLLDHKRHYTAMLVATLPSNSQDEAKQIESSNTQSLKDIQGCKKVESFHNKEHFRNIRVASAVSDELGIEFLHFFQPLIAYKKNLTPVERSVLAERLGRMYGSDWFNFRGVCYLDYQRQYVDHYRKDSDLIPISEDLSSLFAESNDDIFFDTAHYTNDGNKDIAEALLESLTRRGSLRNQM